MWAHFHRCGRIKGCGRPYEPLPLDLDARGNLLVSKICMKLVVYSSRTRGFDGWIFVVSTINSVCLIS
jgi:hypothetical protein